jgi:hypothetical protein
MASFAFGAAERPAPAGAAAAAAVTIAPAAVPAVVTAVGFDPPLPAHLEAELHFRAPAGRAAATASFALGSEPASFAFGAEAHTTVRPLLSLAEYRQRCARGGAAPSPAARRLGPCEPPPFGGHARYASGGASAIETAVYRGSVTVHGLAIGARRAGSETRLVLRGRGLGSPRQLEQ